MRRIRGLVLICRRSRSVKGGKNESYVVFVGSMSPILSYVVISGHLHEAHGSLSRSCNACRARRAIMLLAEYLSSRALQ